MAFLNARSCRVLGEMHAVEMPTGLHIHHACIERENIARETSFRLGLGAGSRSAPCIPLLPSDLCISTGDPPRRVLVVFTNDPIFYGATGRRGE